MPHSHPKPQTQGLLIANQDEILRRIWRLSLTKSN